MQWEEHASLPRRSTIPSHLCGLPYKPMHHLPLYTSVRAFRSIVYCLVHYCPAWLAYCSHYSIIRSANDTATWKRGPSPFHGKKRFLLHSLYLLASEATGIAHFSWVVSICCVCVLCPSSTPLPLYSSTPQPPPPLPTLSHYLYLYLSLYLYFYLYL